MAHQAIYRKWRPMIFDDIVGQTHITKTLKNQIVSGTVGHAYLFCGTRGTGKTSCAKVLSRAVNCLHPNNGNPCNECEICRGIIDGSIMDITEMDAASNNGVDDIRYIKDDLNFVASNAKYTVYIIDEVHMLSTAAFNALLKTLEEPPENVIFILATTEAHKVPQTILSRCQRFDFRRISNDDIIVRMKEISHGDGYDISDDAYRMLARLADGSLRDGLSIMERVISSSGSKITAEDIVNTLGISTRESVFELTDAIINGDSAAVIRILDQVLSDGKDLGQLAMSMLEHFRSLMICKLSDDPSLLMECDAQTLMRFKAQSAKLTFEKIDHASRVIAEAQADARVAKSQRLIYELAYIKLTRPELDRSPESVMDRLAVLENKISSGAVDDISFRNQPVQSSDSSELIKRIEALETAVKNGSVAVSKEEKKTIKEDNEEKQVSARLYSPIPDEELTYDYPTAKLARNWKQTVEIMKQKNIPYIFPYANCVITFDSEGIIVLVPDDKIAFTEKILMSKLDTIREEFKKVTGSKYTIKIARRSDFDSRYIINPFELPHSPDHVESDDDIAKDTEQQPDIAEDKFSDFLERFSEFITDGDKNFDDFDREREVGRQSALTDEEEDDREEFLEANELSSDEDD